MSLAPSSTAILRMALRSIGSRGEESAGLVPCFRGAPAGAAAAGPDRAPRSGCATSPVSSPAITRQTAGMRAISNAARGWRSSASFAFQDVAAKRPSCGVRARPRSASSVAVEDRLRRRGAPRRAPRRSRRPRAGRRAPPRRRRAGPGRGAALVVRRIGSRRPCRSVSCASSTPCSAQSRRRWARSRGPSAAQPPTPTFAWPCLREDPAVAARDDPELDRGAPGLPVGQRPVPLERDPVEDAAAEARVARDPPVGAVGADEHASRARPTRRPGSLLRPVRPLDLRP